jgi:hypothetical protein
MNASHNVRIYVVRALVVLLGIMSVIAGAQNRPPSWRVARIQER